MEAKFTELCEELDNPDLTGWEFFVESHSIKIYRLYKPTSGLYEYKIFGTLPDVPPEISSQVYMDLDYRKTWDSYVKDLRESEFEGQKYIYWQVNFPFPMSNRDYVYQREMKRMERDGVPFWVVMASSVSVLSEPEKSGVVRVIDYTQDCVLTTDGEGGSKAFMWYYDDPRGSIPKWLINWGAKTGVPTFMSQMQSACKKYDEYLRNLHKY